ncbi:MAG: hypothetical protein QNJ46_30655 [Leptolyngbyaceae cyanobacterium MO_188.B28]|nr:hypothetical protein [Leptolyngbyaceae cyanobacterium MO_188.B28]
MSPSIIADIELTLSELCILIASAEGIYSGLSPQKQIKMLRGVHNRLSEMVSEETEVRPELHPIESKRPNRKAFRISHQPVV